MQVGGKQASADSLARTNVAPAVVCMANIKFTEHFAEAIGHIASRADAVSQRAVLFPYALPIHPVHLRIVEKVPLQAPGLA